MTMTFRPELAAYILRLQEAYDAGSPEVTDAEYDALVAQLKADPALGAKGTVKHATPMLSLQKAYTDAELQKWRATVGDVVVTPKLDGVALRLTYQKGVLVQAATRGDGLAGEDVTAHARLFCPSHFETEHGNFEIRGEAILPTAYSVETNRRNVVAGMLGKKTPGKDTDKIRFVAYDARPSPSYVDTYVTLLRVLRTEGFETPSPIAVRRSASEVVVTVDPVACQYDTDGKVYTVNDLSQREKFGETSHHPRWAIAWKPPDAAQETTVVSIEWNVGRTGVITPVANVESVRLSGVNVTKATLHNAGRAEELGIGPGARVLMTRRGSVIPHVESVITKGEAFHLPKRCPSCEGGVDRYGVNLRCRLPWKCPQAIAARLEFYAKTLGVDGFGPAAATNAVNLCCWDSPYDFYMENAVGWKAIGAFVVLPTNPDLGLFLEALGIEGVGGTASQKVAEAFGDISDVLKASVEDFQKIGGLGPSTAQALAAGLITPWVVSTLQAVSPKPVHKIIGSLSGQSFVFTGELRISRAEAQSRVKAKGGSCPAGVSKKTTWLVVGKNPGADKTGKAERYGVPTMDEESFFALVGTEQIRPKDVVRFGK